jgi:glycosyltransferase involved in cell wall biosynthesis
LNAPLAITAYPLSRGYRERLEASLHAEPVYVSLPQLRRLPALEFLRTMHGFRGRRCLLPLEDEASLAIVPALHAVSALARPATIEVVRPDLSVSRLSALQLLRALAALTHASAEGQRAAARSRRELTGLSSAPRIVAELGPGRRVLYVNPNLWFGLRVGGSVGHIAGVLNGLVEIGYDVEAFSATEPALVSPAVRFERLRAPDSFGFPLELNFQRFHHRLIADVVERSHSPHAFLYQRNAIASYVGAVLSRRLGAPLVLEYNGSEVWAARNWGRPLKYEKLALEAEDVSLRHASVIVTVSNVLHEELLSRGIPAERVVMHPNGVDASLYDSNRFGDDERRSLREQHGLDDQAVVATFVGTFGHWHGADLLARAIAHLIDHDAAWVAERRLHFLFVGDGLRMEEVRTTLTDERYQRFTTLTGLVPQERGPAYLAASDILLSPHLPNPDGTPFFGSPTKLFEYMAMSKGIVASDLDQIGEVLSPAVSGGSLPEGDPADEEAALGVLVRPGDEGELLLGLRFLVERPLWREKLGRNARERVLERYTWRHHVRAILERVDALAAEPRPKAA